MEPILGHNAGLPTQSITTKYRHKLTQRITDELHSPAFRKSAKNDPLQEHRNNKCAGWVSRFANSTHLLNGFWFVFPSFSHVTINSAIPTM